VTEIKAAEVGSTASSYAILAKLATGGMAEIFLARTESAAGVERHVVLKRVLPQRATDIAFVHMFLDEVRLASQLQHPNIAQVFDTGKLGDSYFFTMEYVHGETVRELLHRSYAVGQPIPIGCALTIVAGAAAGLHHAHERVGTDGQPLGIVHRDVSPSNLMVSYEGNVKVVDFGVAKASHRSSETQAGTVKGKIGYMAPEQCRGSEIDLRCDVFSLGIVLWELLVGERLFKRVTDYESMEAIVDEPTPPPSSKRPDIPPELDAVVLKLLAKDPDDRYQSAEEAHEAIETVAMQAGISLSVPALRRFIRELFGQRPEPWVEMRIRQGDPEVVTVTGAPSVGSSMLNSHSLDGQLDKLVDLSSYSITPPPGPALAPAPPPARPITRTSGKVVIGDSSRSLLDATGPTVAHPSDRFGQVAAAASDDELDARPVRRGRGLLRVALVLAAGAGAGALLYAWRGPPVHEEPAVVASLGVDAGAPGARPRVAATVPADAAAAEAPVAPEPPVVPEPIDAAVERKPPRISAPPTRRPPAQAEDLSAVYRAARYDDVVASCAASTRVAAANAVSCTLAACRQHALEAAQRWVVKVPSTKREATISDCESFGTKLVAAKPLPPKPRCDDTDPMACRQ